MNVKSLHTHSIRGRVFLFAIFTTLTFGLTSLYSTFSAQVFMSGIIKVFQRNQTFLDVGAAVSAVVRHLEAYLASKTSEDLLNYWKSHQKLTDLTLNLDRRPRPDPISLTKKNILFLTDAFLKASETAVNAKRGRNVSRYQEAWAETRTIAGYIAASVESLNALDFQTSLVQGRKVFDLLNLLQTVNLFMVTTLTLLGVLLAFWFSYTLSRPIVQLTESVEQISQGNYNTAFPRPSRDETGILTKAFIQMRDAILKNLQDLKEKAEIESGLLEERLKNLQMKNLLKNAELQALQAQINPHFLFNTLNAGAQLALMEDAEQTNRFLANLAALFRHNIRPLDKPVHLSQEIESLQHYLYLQKIRFGDRFQFIWAIQENYENLKVPAMVLQPLVENALVHGLKNRESGGWVKIEVTRVGAFTMVAVEDNGEGIQPRVVRTILRKPLAERHGHPASEKSTGIGLSNVVERLRLYFDRKNLVTIRSEIGQGTRVQFLLPSHKEFIDA